MSKFQVGDRARMPGTPFVVEVLELGVCDEDDDLLHEDLDAGAETFRFADPVTGAHDWAHSGEFERASAESEGASR